MAEYDVQKHDEAVKAAVKESTDRCFGEKTLNGGDLDLSGYHACSNRKYL